MTTPGVGIVPSRTQVAQRINFAPDGPTRIDVDDAYAMQNAIATIEAPWRVRLVAVLDEFSFLNKRRWWRKFSGGEWELWEFHYSAGGQPVPAWMLVDVRWVRAHVHDRLYAQRTRDVLLAREDWRARGVRLVLDVPVVRKDQQQRKEEGSNHG